MLRQAHEGRLLTEDYLVELQNSTVSNPFDKAVAFRHEQNHLHNGLRGAAGVSYVPPAPELCQELMEELMAFDFIGHPSIYRYWDATRRVEFTLQMARRALEVELREETEFLDRYDRVIKAVNQRFDVRGSDLSRLVMMCLDNDGKVSKHRRKQFQYSVSEEVFEFIEQEVGDALREIGKFPID
ncbi:hypothetical protein ALP39_01740 [Pseudomonas marginalis pv. marginalis]|nr:hypothetical protein ALP39_01740 [Pseudomonas marginalis pv. marginalis]